MATTPMHFTPAQNVTGKAKGAISQGTFVTVAGDIVDRTPVVQTGAAGSVPFGVAAYNAADGEHVTIYRVGIYELAATGSITAGDPVAVAASGKATKASDGSTVAGIAVSASANGTVAVALK